MTIEDLLKSKVIENPIKRFKKELEEIVNSNLVTKLLSKTKLKKENFAKYLELDETIDLSTSNLEQIIFYGFSQESLDELYSSIEYHLSSGHEPEGNFLDAINQIKSRLPRYYINFDRQIYLHTDHDYSPESSVSYKGWVASVGDFSYYIPDSKNYWISNEKNFWKTMYL